MTPRMAWRPLATITLTTLAVLSCSDERPDVVDPHVQAAKACPPGQVGKSCEPELPPTPPPDPQLPGVFVEGMASPIRLDHTPLGWLLVTDSRLRMVLRIDPVTLQPYQGFGTRGKPLGVTALGTSIYVGNPDQRTVDVYAADGGRMTSSFGPGAVDHAADLAADTAARLIFALDGGRREVRVFDRHGTPLRTISGPGTLPEQLENPTALGLDPTRQWVLVSDYGSADGGYASLKVFGYDGTFVTSVSGRGSCGMLGCSGGFSRPQGAAVDARGRVYLPDALLSEVLVFDPATWQITQRLGGRSTLRVPTDVVFDARGDLFVASSRNQEVYVIRGIGQP